MSSTDGVNVREAGLDNKRNKPRRKNKKSVRCVGEVLKDWVAKIFWVFKVIMSCQGSGYLKKIHFSYTHNTYFEVKHSSLVKLPSDHDFFSKTVKLNVPLPQFRRTKFCNPRTSVSDSWALPQTLLLAKFIPLYRSYWQISSLLVALDDPELLLHLQNTFQPILTQYLFCVWYGMSVVVDVCSTLCGGPRKQQYYQILPIPVDENDTSFD